MVAASGFAKNGYATAARRENDASGFAEDGSATAAIRKNDASGFAEDGYATSGQAKKLRKRLCGGRIRDKRDGKK